MILQFLFVNSPIFFSKKNSEWEVIFKLVQAFCQLVAELETGFILIMLGHLYHYQFFLLCPHVRLWYGKNK